tara:strand:+ start:787 stop:1488 length:702 start_codon:yes stop_codon:yes gene_type:complete
VKQIVLKALQQSRQQKQAVALVSDVRSGDQQLVYADSQDNFSLDLSETQLQQIRRLLHQGRSAYLSVPNDVLFVRSYLPRNRLIIVGAVHITQFLAEMASAVGFEIIIIDPRRGFASEQRFSRFQVICEWPDDVLATIELDPSTALVTLSHDPKIDDLALKAALRSDVFYIGALGSLRSHNKRINRLSALGDILNKISAPIGLKIGGRAPAEIAVSILAEIIQARYLPEQDRG